MRVFSCIEEIKEEGRKKNGKGWVCDQIVGEMDLEDSEVVGG